MMLSRTILGIIIFLVIPLLGIAMYRRLVRKMRSEELISAPNDSYFVLFAVYGAWLVLILSSTFIGWSGMHSIGFFALVFIAPFVLFAVSRSIRPERFTSRYHEHAYVACILYVPLVVVFIAVMAALSDVIKPTPW